MDENRQSASKVRVGVIGVGKMGLSHLSIARALENVDIAGVVDATDYLLDILGKYTGVRTFDDAEKMFNAVQPDAVVIATPTSSHAKLVRAALDRGIHVFCEKPLTLSAAESKELSKLARERGLIAQVGYHNRFIATFQEVKRLVDLGAIGRVTHVLAEAYGPVVLKPKGSTWRSKRATGGGCLYDYAAHPLDLVHWFVGAPSTVRGTILNSIFSSDTDDEVYSTLVYDDGLSVQLSVNWSDESYRKMSTSVTLSGTMGRITADRQELRVYLREGATIPEGYRTGWNVLYTTDLTEQVSFYLRGEEYSAQLESFAEAVAAGETEARQNGFPSAAETDRVIEMMLRDAAGEEPEPDPDGTDLPPVKSGSKRRFSLRRKG